jgi:hypothetical protein
VIQGYAEQPSPRAGAHVVLRVATDAPRFRVELYRCGESLVPCSSSDWFPGRNAPPHLPFQDWSRPNVGLNEEPLEAWPAYALFIPKSWPSGVYVAVLVEADEDGRDRSDPDRTTPDARNGKALFVVRPAGGTAPILYKLPLLTYHAYNQAGSWCLYTRPESESVPAGVSLHRPGGGTGGTPWDIFNVDPFDPTPRQTYVHWDGRFVAWLERMGYAVDFCTDVDLHREGHDLLAPYRLLLSAGHDEYWSDAMRAAVDGFVRAGGNVAFFGGNTCWWRVVFSDDVTFERVAFWYETGSPENTTIGVSFRNGGERDRNDFPIPVGYRVQRADHWVFAGTGLRGGDVFGDRPEEYLLGYECDGAAFDRVDLEAGRPVRPTGTDGTPLDFTILAVGDTRPSGWGLGNAAATLGLFTAGGTVFNAATTDWARVLTSGTNPVVERITRNVIDRLAR